MPLGNPPWNFGQISKLVPVTGPWDGGRSNTRTLSNHTPPMARTGEQNCQSGTRENRNCRSNARIGNRTGNFWVKSLKLNFPKERHKLKTWLFDSQGNAGGAYFTEVELIKGP